MSLGKYSLIFSFIVLIGCSQKSADLQQGETAQTQTSIQDTVQISPDSASTAKSSVLNQSSFRFKPMAANRISPYDHMIKKYSRRFGFDWRLIAAQIFAESHFRPSAKSHVGAIGLMQIMPNTAKHMKVDPGLLLKPEQNISLGCLYDRQLYNR